jgi:putative tricarboxylic transport membrane protein
VTGLLDNLALGFAVAGTIPNLAYCLTGVLIGMLVGVLPGIGSLAAISLLLPISFHLSPTSAIILLSGIYYGAEYGGSITSILLKLPGTPSSAVTCLDGNPMARQGRAGIALFMTTIASFVGATLGICAVIVLAPLLAQLARQIASAEYFAIMLFALVASATITQGSPVKGLAMVVVGLMLGTVGTDVETGTSRFTLGLHPLYDGISLVALTMGLFGVAEVIGSVADKPHAMIKRSVTLRSMLPSRDDLRRSWRPILRGCGTGGMLGALPGAGVTISSFLAYALEKRVAREPARFGKGAIEGVCAPESANNAAAQTAFIPTLTIGIPGSATMAVMLAALMIHGIAPGPAMVSDHPDVFWGLIASFWIGNLLLVVINIPLIGIWVRLLLIPYAYLFPVVIGLVCIGAFAVVTDVFNVWVVLLAGLAGYALRLARYEPAPLLIGFVLGPLIEENFRRAMLLSRGDPSYFLDRPISLIFLLMTVLLLLHALHRHRSRPGGLEHE